MKNLLLVFVIVFTCISRAQQPSLPDVEKRLEEEVSKVRAQKEEKIKTLRQNYLTALLRLEATSRANGDLDGLQAARDEIQRIDGTKPLAVEAPSTHTELRRLQDVISGQLGEFSRTESKALADLVSAVTRFAETTSTTLTQQNRIEEAMQFREWSRGLLQRPEFAEALQQARVETPVTPPPGDTPVDTAQVHPQFGKDPVPFQASGEVTFGEEAKAYILGQEPKATEKRVNMSTPSAQGSGLTLISAQLRLVDEENTVNKNFTGWSSHRQKTHLFVGRLQMTPLPGRSIGRSLVTFDLYKKGSGSRREIIRTDSILIPPVAAGQQVVVDSGVYAYETEKYRYTGGYRYESATADEFNGYIVSVFDERGKLILQRSSDRQLDDYARTEPPAVAAEAE